MYVRTKESLAKFNTGSLCFTSEVAVAAVAIIASRGEL